MTSERLMLIPTDKQLPNIGDTVLCLFKSGNYMVCRFEEREGKLVFAIPSGWYAPQNAYWLVVDVKSFAFLPKIEHLEADNAN